VRLGKLLRCQKGGTAIEYALVAVIIAIGAIGAMGNLSDHVNGQFNNVASHL
jgi:Flp pilus assembly pilin Flp